MDRLPNWAVLSMIPAAAVLMPVLGFSIALVAAIILGVLKEAGPPTVLALAAAGLSGFLLGWKSALRKSTTTPLRLASVNVTAFPASLPRLAGQPRGRIKTE